MRFILLTILLAFFSSACSQKKTETAPPESEVETNLDVKPKVELVSAVDRNGTITITIKGIPWEEMKAMSGSYVVSQERELKLPYLKDRLNFTGCSLEEIACRIERAYIGNKIYKSPEVTVTNVTDRGCINVHQRFYTISGQVEKSGLRPWRPGVTLIEALHEAFIIDPDLDHKILLSRNGKTYRYDLQNLEHGKLRLYPNDQVVLSKQWLFFK